MEQREYPPEAYCDDGRLWWDRKFGDGPRGADGSVPRMASWLRWNVELNGRFTTRAMREALGVDHEHFQRRQRELREKLGWKYLSSKEEPSLGDECILLEYGWGRETGSVHRARRYQLKYVAKYSSGMGDVV